MMRSYVYLAQIFFLPNQIRRKQLYMQIYPIFWLLRLAQRPGYVEGNTL